MRNLFTPILCTVVIIALLIATGFILATLIDTQAATSVTDIQTCGPTNEEVIRCLPVQQCTVNNSVNSAKLCSGKKPFPGGEGLFVAGKEKGYTNSFGESSDTQ